MLTDRDAVEKPSIRLLEYDKRFEVIGPDFVHYDFEHPIRLPAEMKGKFDRIICDPPFLSEDCQTKAALTVRFLAKDWSAPLGGSPNVRFICCTGERMEHVLNRLYARIGVQPTTFEPQHSKGLSNAFSCYANFECEDWKWP